MSDDENEEKAFVLGHRHESLPKQFLKAKKKKEYQECDVLLCTFNRSLFQKPWVKVLLDLFKTKVVHFKRLTILNCNSRKTQHLSSLLVEVIHWDWISSLILDNVNIVGKSWVKLAPSFSNATKLKRIAFIPGYRETKVDIVEAIEAFAECPNLTSLLISNVGPEKQERQQTYMSSVDFRCFKYLVKLNLHLSNFEDVQFLHELTELPSLKQLNISDTHRDVGNERFTPDMMNRFITGLSSSRCSITQLVMRVYGFTKMLTPDMFEYLLTSCHKLEWLCLHSHVRWESVYIDSLIRGLSVNTRLIDLTLPQIQNLYVHPFLFFEALFRHPRLSNFLSISTTRFAFEEPERQDEDHWLFDELITSRLLEARNTSMTSFVFTYYSKAVGRFRSYQLMELNEANLDNRQTTLSELLCQQIQSFDLEDLIILNDDES
jgi:hypothetical protein